MNMYRSKIVIGHRTTSKVTPTQHPPFFSPQHINTCWGVCFVLFWYLGLDRSTLLLGKKSSTLFFAHLSEDLGVLSLSGSGSRVTSLLHGQPSLLAVEGGRGDQALDLGGLGDVGLTVLTRDDTLHNEGTG